MAGGLLESLSGGSPVLASSYKDKLVVRGRPWPGGPHYDPTLAKPVCVDLPMKESA